MPQVIAATPAQIQQLRAAALAFEEYAGGVSRVVGVRFAYWAALKQQAARYGINPADIVGAKLALEHDAADAHARQWATAVRALDTGHAQLAAWTQPTEGGAGPLRLGVVQTGTLPIQVGVWPIVPIVVYAAGAVLSVGTWLLADAWITAKQTEAEALSLQTQTQAKITQAVIQAGQTSPAAATALADAIAKANASAQQPTSSIFDQLANAVGGAAQALSTGPGLVGMGLLFLAWMWFQSRQRGEQRSSGGPF